MRDAPTPARHGALFLVPVPPRGHGPVAAWISTAEWATAAANRWGAAWVVGPGGLVDLEKVATVGSRPELKPPAKRTWRRRVPTTVKTAVRDVARVRAGRRFELDVTDGPWVGHDLVCVWQRHEPFVTAGRAAAQALGCPLVAFVPAPIVWEAEAWGVHRPGWGRLMARLGEAPVLCNADVVACGSVEVAEVVERFGVPSDRIIVSPNGVDVDRFAPSPVRAETRARLGVADRFVVAWSGSFRGFHGLDLLVDAVALAGTRLDDIVLLVVGDGPERPRVERRCNDLGVSVVTTGTVPHDDVAGYLGAADAAVVAAPGGGEVFHYSPLKLWEFLACGLATVAPSVGQPASILTDGVDSLVVEPGSSEAIADALVRLHDDDELRCRIGHAARDLAVGSLSWDNRLQVVERALGHTPS